MTCTNHDRLEEKLDRILATVAETREDLSFLKASSPLYVTRRELNVESEKIAKAFEDLKSSASATNKELRVGVVKATEQARINAGMFVGIIMLLLGVAVKSWF